MNFSITDKYLFTFTLRRDGTSRFAEDNRWGMFPSAAFAYKILDGRSGWLNALKLRLSYGETGQQEISSDYYPYLARYQSSLSTALYQFGDEFYTTLRPNGYDAKIKWEETATYNAGLDYELLQWPGIWFATNTTSAKPRTCWRSARLRPVPTLTNFFTQCRRPGKPRRGTVHQHHPVPKRQNDLGSRCQLYRQQNEITRLPATDDPNFPGLPPEAVLMAASATSRSTA
ncbi:MAG: TonB-dependent receptor [Saprospirales bacterium]|nr:TonB-dependent receptor [Saprospirales bacterium]